MSLKTFSLALSAVICAGSFAAAAPASLTLASSDVAEGRAIAAEQILNGFGCTGGNISPELRWSGAPAATKSFALTVYDPDAPRAAAGGIGWWSTSPRR